jgi:RNA polymerase sigma factor (TIGR02999 family)
MRLWEQPLPSSDQITRLLQAHQHGDERAFDRLMPLVYEDLRQVARQQLSRRGRNPTLSPTALVHEAYLRLVDETGVSWQSRAHFLAIGARTMRRIIVDYARERGAQKRGGRKPHLPLEPDRVGVEEHVELLIALDEALSALGSFNERLAEVAECRLFGGMTEEETAAAVGVSIRTVQRDWKRARAWLQQGLSP